MLVQDCTANSPMPQPQPTGTRWRHLDEEMFTVVQDADGDVDYALHSFKCPHCGRKTTLDSNWSAELVED